MKKYLNIHVLVLSSQLLSFGAFAGEVWGFPWLRLNNPDTLLREQMSAQNNEEEGTPEEMRALRELAEDVALNALDEEAPVAARDQLQEIAEDVAFKVLDEEESNANTYDFTSSECAEESSDCCEELCADEAESPSSETPSSVPVASSNEENRHPKFKTELCERYMNHGECKFGKDCNFAHGKKQLRHPDPKFKTTLCRNWKLFGRCSYGNKCNFAHGDGELRK